MSNTEISDFQDFNFANLDLDAIREYTKKMKDDPETKAKWKSDPMGELKKFGINIKKGSVLEKKVIEGNKIGFRNPDKPCYYYGTEWFCFFFEDDPFNSL